MDSAHTNTSELSVKRYGHKGRKTSQSVVDLINAGLDAAEFQIFSIVYFLLHHKGVLD
jgi:hypothetical protein